MNRQYLSTILALLCLSLLAFLSFYHLESTPPLWWDEGWTMNVARNWVQSGFYGQSLEGELQPPGLSAAFPVVVPVAISFKIFGVGIWQGRLPGTLFMLAAILLISRLAYRLYDRRVAWLTLILLLLMPLNEKLHPILIGRQVLGEAPTLFYLLLGYWMLFFALDKHPFWIIPAALLWGIAMRTKAQVPPFWLLSVLLPVTLALYKRWWRELIILMTGVVVTWLAMRGMDSFQTAVLSGKVLSQSALDGYLSMSALVPVVHIRVWAGITGITFGLGVIAGLVYALIQMLKSLRRDDLVRSASILRLALWGLSASWMAWYLLLAMYWPRFLFPALFTGSLFAAALIHDLTGSLDLSYTIRNASSLLLNRNFSRRSSGALLAVFLIAWFIGVSGLIMVISYPALTSSAVQQTVLFLESKTPSQALIESYESQLFFLLDRRWHYPPDQVHVQLNRRSLIDPSVPIEYDPLAANPDYLVVGPSAGEWRLYDDVLESGDFLLVQAFPPYEIYARAR